MDLDVTIKNEALAKDNLVTIFTEVLDDTKKESFVFSLDSLAPIRKDDAYGGYKIKINAYFETLNEVVFIDVTTGDEIKLLSYNIETVLAEKLESVVSRGTSSTRPRDRYDLFTLWNLRKDEVDIKLLRLALINTATKRDTIEELSHWEEQLDSLLQSDYQKRLWSNYQYSFSYASKISFEESVMVVKLIFEIIM